MDNPEEALGKLLNDPGAMAQIMSLAQSLGAAPPQESIPNEAAEAPRHVALIRALSPYLSAPRRQKLEKAMQLARLSALAGSALHEPEKGR